MGCNYYHRTNICEGCGRYDEQHIGKNSAGWTFSFQGYYEDNDPDDDESTPPATAIHSYRDWLRVLEAGGKIYNEYGERVTLEEFKELVEDRRTAPHNHTTYCQIHHPTDDCWLDEEGHSFSSADFT
jgi:hypothetical protein